MIIFCEKVSLLGVHYHFRLASVHYIESTNKSWQGSEPPLFGNANFWKRLLLQPLPGSKVCMCLCVCIPEHLTGRHMINDRQKVEVGSKYFPSALHPPLPSSVPFARTNNILTWSRLGGFPSPTLSKWGKKSECILQWQDRKSFSGKKYLDRFGEKKFHDNSHKMKHPCFSPVRKEVENRKTRFFVPLSLFLWMIRQTLQRTLHLAPLTTESQTLE